MLSSALAAIGAAAGPVMVGSIKGTVGLSVDVIGLDAAAGELLECAGAVYEVVSASQSGCTALPLDNGPTPAPGTEVRKATMGGLVPVGAGLLGRVIDPIGRPLDGKGPLANVTWVPAENSAPNPMTRRRISSNISTGVRALDVFTSLGAGQRMGLFAGSGVGKSSLLSMIARGTSADMSVIGLIGERGREVREFLEDDLGEAGLARSVVVVATGDTPPLMRHKAAFTAMRIAEAMRDAGGEVLTLMDSLTRVAMAHREIALAAGEVPANRGYPPSMPSMLAGLLERAGANEYGSVSGLYTVLVDGDDHNDPVADAARSILDGHIVLTRDLAVKNHFPSIDVLGSVSRTASKTNTREHQAVAGRLRRAMSAARSKQDLRDVGAYQPGMDPWADAGIALQEALDSFLTQSMDEQSTASDAWSWAEQLAQGVPKA